LVLGENHSERVTARAILEGIIIKLVKLYCKLQKFSVGGGSECERERRRAFSNFVSFRTATKVVWEKVLLAFSV